MIDASTLNVGDDLFSATLPGSSRSQIAAFSEATQDPNPIHVSKASAQTSGFADVIQQGPMTTAHFARLLSQAVGAKAMTSLDVTFLAPVFPEQDLHIVGTVVRVQAGEVEIALTAETLAGVHTAKGAAILAVGSKR
jgi:acyl dehydratase